MSKKLQQHVKIKKILGNDFSNLLFQLSPLISPRIDVFTTEKDFFILADVAGANPKDIRVSLQGNVVQIDGTIHNYFIKNDSEIYNQERFYGPFSREVKIPDDCLLNELTAIYEKGILMIRIPFIITEWNNEEKVDIEIKREDIR